MKVQELSLKRIDIPFRVSFRHASAERRETESVWVEARSASGRVGYGEGCPRSYVTGETLGSATTFFEAHRSALLDEISSLADLERWGRLRREVLDANPAAWCAIELALLDLLAQEGDASIESALGLSELPDTFRYSAVIGDDEPETFASLWGCYRRAGFLDFKLKLSGDLERDRAKLHRVREDASTDLRLRVDANNLWSGPAQALRYLDALDYPFFAIEEPLQPGRFQGLSELAREGLTLILDESLLRRQHIARLSGLPGRWIANIRVSKMGGVLRALSLVEAARSAGIGVIVGAHVGETSLLTRAGLTVASAAGDLLVAQEGAFGPLLLQRDVCDPPLIFGAAGTLSTELLGRVGLGLAIDPELPCFTPLV